MDILPNTSLGGGRFLVEHHLGEGGMAVVYAVRHLDLDVRMALKVMRVASPHVRQRLLREARAQATLRHPNVVGVTDVLTVNGQPALLMELVEGPPLDRVLACTRLTVDQVDAIARGLFDGMDEAHGRGIVHRDLKPSNVLLALTRRDVVPRITDFGLVKFLDQTGPAVTRSGQMMGTPAYMPPEQVTDAGLVDHRADLFALGTLLYELATGERAFPGSDPLRVIAAIGACRFTPPRDVVPDLPDRMVRAIEGALKADPDERWSDVAAMREAWIADAPSQPRADVWPERTRSRIASLVEGPRVIATGSETYNAETLARPDRSTLFPPASTELPPTPTYGDFADACRAVLADELANLRAGGRYLGGDSHLPRRRLEDELTAFRGGNRPLLLLVGPSGCGKTDLMVWFAEERAATGDAAVWLDATRLDRAHAVSGAGLVQALEARVGRPLPTARNDAAVLVLVDAFDRVLGTEFAQQALFRALQDLVAARPVVRVVLAMRAETFAALTAALAHGVDPDGVCFRPRDVSGAPSEVAAHAVYVPPLSADEAHRLLTIVASDNQLALTWDDLPTAWKHTVQTPFALRELAGLWAETATVPAGSASAAALVEARVGRLGQRDQRALFDIADRIKRSPRLRIPESEVAGRWRESLDELVRKGFVRRVHDDHEVGLELAHDQLLDFLVSSHLSLAARATLTLTLRLTAAVATLGVVIGAGLGAATAAVPADGALVGTGVALALLAVVFPLGLFVAVINPVLVDRALRTRLQRAPLDGRPVTLWDVLRLLRLRARARLTLGWNASVLAILTLGALGVPPVAAALGAGDWSFPIGMLFCGACFGFALRVVESWGVRLFPTEEHARIRAALDAVTPIRYAEVIAGLLFAPLFVAPVLVVATVALVEGGPPGVVALATPEWGAALARLTVALLGAAVLMVVSERVAKRLGA